MAFVELEPWFFLCLFVDTLVASEIPLFLPKTLVNRCLMEAGGVGPTVRGGLGVPIFSSMETGECASASWSRNEFGGDGGVTCRPERFGLELTVAELLLLNSVAGRVGEVGVIS